MLGRRGALGRMLGIGAGAALAPFADKLPNLPPAATPSVWPPDALKYIGGAAQGVNPTPLSAAAQLLNDEARAFERRMEEAHQYRHAGMDPDIASLRSVSWASKGRMQRERNESMKTLGKSLWERFHKAAGWR